MDDLAELAATGVDWVADKYWDTGYDYVRNKRLKHKKAAPRTHAAATRGIHHKDIHRLPDEATPGDPDPRYTASEVRGPQRGSSLERQSQASEQVIRAYESERDDPRRRPETVLSKKDLTGSQQRGRMSYANGYADQRPRSAQPPRHRHYYDDDSDYDERTGRRYSATGRGYGYTDEEPAYNREVIETERYRGPPREYETQRGNVNYPTRSTGNEGYAGAVTQYRRSQNDIADYQSRHSRSRGRKSEYRERDSSSSRSRSRSRSNDGIKGKLDDTFDTSMRGLGVGLAGAVVGGLVGKQFGQKQRDRDILIGAVVGGLGANAAENKWRDYNEEKEKKYERQEDRWEQKWTGQGHGRSRSAGR